MSQNLLWIPTVALAQTAAEIELAKAMAEAKTKQDAQVKEDKAKAEQQKAEQAAIDQKNAQQANADTSNKGDSMAQMLGIGLTAAGGIMVAIGMAQKPPNTGLIAGGMFMIAGGVGSMMAGNAMGNNANKSGQNIGGLNSLYPTTNPGGSLTDPKTGVGPDGKPNGLVTDTGNIVNPDGSPGTRAKLDPDMLKNGKLGEILDKFQAKTGMSSEDLAKGLASGVPPAELLAGIGGLSKDELQQGIDNAAKSGGEGGGALSGQDIAKLASETGLGDLYAGASEEGGADFSGGASGAAGGGGRAPAAAGPEKFDFSKLAGNDGPGAGATMDFNQMSENVRKELERQGRTDKTLFQLVSIRYKKMTPQLFGEEKVINAFESEVKKSLDSPTL